MATVHTTFDAITKWAGRYDKNIIAQILNGLTFLEDVRTYPNASTNGTLLPKMTVSNGNRKLNLNVETNNKGQRNFSGRKLIARPAMKIIDIKPEESYNTFLADMIVPGAKEMPYAQWIWEQEFNKIAAELNDNLYFSTYQDPAIWSSAATYAIGAYVYFGSEENIYKCLTATSAGESPTTAPAKWLLADNTVICDGWGQIIANEITASNISPIATGALTASNAIQKLEQMYDAMTAAHKNIGGVFNISINNWNNYIRNYRTLYPFAVIPGGPTGYQNIYGNPKWIVKPAVWLGTSNRVIATQKNNIVFGTNSISDMNKIGQIVPTVHGFRTSVKWTQCCEISDLETLYVNDQV